MYCKNCERETQTTFICPIYNRPSNQAGCAWRTDGNPACCDHWEDAPCQGAPLIACQECGAFVGDCKGILLRDEMEYCPNDCENYGICQNIWENMQQ